MSIKWIEPEDPEVPRPVVCRMSYVVSTRARSALGFGMGFGHHITKSVVGSKPPNRLPKPTTHHTQDTSHHARCKPQGHAQGHSQGGISRAMARAPGPEGARGTIKDCKRTQDSRYPLFRPHISFSYPEF